MATPEHESPRKAPSRRFLALSAIAGVVVVVLVIAGVMWLSGDSSAKPKPRPEASCAERIDLAALTESTTHTRIDDAPADDAPTEGTRGAIVHPRTMTPVFAAPDGDPIAKIGPEQLGDTWLPVIDKRDDWVKVLLPSKPNGSSGWLCTEDLERAVTPYEIRVHLGSMTMELFFEGREDGSWTVGIGKKDTPTPTGRTFLLGSIVDPDQQYSPVILPLGTHSATLDTFGGGPGTVAIHTWPTTDVLGTESSEGCIRVPEDALDRLKEVPLGTLVLVDEK